MWPKTALMPMMDLRISHGDLFSKPPVALRLETLFMNANYGALEFLDGATDFKIRANIFSIRGDKSFIVMDRSSKPGALIDANCFHNRAGRARGLGAHSTVGDPRFVNPANNDFRLQKGSPCANAGAEPADIAQPRFSW
jgi:hypothetical protein